LARSPCAQSAPTRAWRSCSSVRVRRIELAMGTPYKVATRPFLTESEARAAAAFLESEGIQCTLARNDPMGAAPVLGFSPGTQLLVSAEYQSRARELLGAVDSGALRALSESEYATESLKDNQPLSQEVIQVGLSRICRRRPDVWIIFLSLPVVGTFAVLSRSDTLAMYFAFFWMVLFALASLRVSLSRCPRCGRLFHMRRVGSNPWTPWCLHCKLPLKSSEGTP